ncbi:MAG: class I SAM-dependent methyltransferase [Chthoniobacteraceae bacterium]
MLRRAARSTGQTLVDPAQIGPKDQYLDAAEFRYVLWLDRIYAKIAHVPGHVVELGVARGRNSIIFGHLVRMNGDEEVRKYYGFDTFDGYPPDDLAGNPQLRADTWRGIGREFVEKRVANVGLARQCNFIEGDLKQTVPDFLKAAPNFRAALLYVDCNAYQAALAGMEAFREHMTPGGIICIDEKRQGGETKALIEFCQRHGYRFMKDDSPFAVPAYTTIAS